MSPSPVIDLIRREGGDDKAVFVFPSDIAASLWMDEALAITGRNTLPARRFIAWDRFKEQAVQATVAGKKPVSAVIRKLYALKLAKRNAAEPLPLFSSLIPGDFAADGHIFAAWLARLLPQLEMWERKTAKAPDWIRDAEDADLAFLKTDYRKFLDSHLLFEPSWQRPPLVHSGDRYFIFFPEAIEDFGEYADLIGSAPFITCVPVPVPDIGEETPVAVHENTRGELRSAALQVEELVRSGTAPEKIALSVCDLDTVAPYLLREFSLRSIPLEFRAGSPLGSRPAGRLFSLVQECASAHFSFAAVKALLLDRLIPWKDRQMSEDLTGFGIRNHCVTSWKENGQNVDIWEEAFKAPSQGEYGDRDIRAWFRRFRNAVTQMTGARTFTEIRNRYFSFRESFLDPDRYESADNAVVARCIDELNALASLESAYADCIPDNPFSFFTSLLDEKKYVPQRANGGVSVFPYRVAAGTPFPHHFVLDASQNQATVLYRQLTFLREDKRGALNLREDDASAAFFGMYRISGNARFSFSERTFSGYRTPHGYFNGELKAEEPITDPFADELRFLAAPADGVSAADPFPGPDRLYPVQKAGRTAWTGRNVERGFSCLKEAYGGRLERLTALVRARQMKDGDIRVSQKDLNTFAVCNTRWFFDRILRIEAESADAELMNERNLGLLYHDVLKNVYQRIKDTDRTFVAAHLEHYRLWAADFAVNAAAEHAEFRGPLAAPLISTLAGKITDGVAGMLGRDTELLDGFEPDLLEDDLSFPKDGVLYYGMIDRISGRRSDGTAVLIDYKSGKPSGPADYVPDAKGRIRDYQIPMYVALAEDSDKSGCKGKKIENAWFGDIREADYRPIIDDGECFDHGRKKGMRTRDEFEGAMKAFREMTAAFADAIKTENFTRPADLPWEECTRCDYQKTCRHTYAVRP